MHTLSWKKPFRLQWLEKRHCDSTTQYLPSAVLTATKASNRQHAHNCVESKWYKGSTEVYRWRVCNSGIEFCDAVCPAEGACAENASLATLRKYNHNMSTRVSPTILDGHRPATSRSDGRTKSTPRYWATLMSV